jgi:propionyl-CoA carboxylase alpha chain
VTEAVTGLDLVRLQLLIASGEPLPDEVHAAVAAGPRGHAIETRIYAEDPTRQWLPSTGTLHRFEIGSADAGEWAGTGVRVDSGVESGSVVSPHYDPMLAKVIVHAPSRTEAATTLSATLAGARIHGVITNRDLLVRTLRHPGFLAGDTDTGFLDRHGVTQLAAPLADDDAVRRHSIAAALAGQARRRHQAPVQPSIPSGFRNNPSAPQRTSFDRGETTIDVAYQFDRSGRTLAAVEVDGNPVDLDDAAATTDLVTLTTGGVARRYRVEWVGRAAFVDGPDGSSSFLEHERFPIGAEHVAEGSARAPMPGGVARVAVAVGDVVDNGQLLVVLEAMKMEHTVHAGAAGTVTEVDVAPGDQVETGQILVVVEPEGGDQGEPTAADGAAP